VGACRRNPELVQIVSEGFNTGFVADGSLHSRQCQCGVGEQLGEIAPSDPEGAVRGMSDLLL
jgi:hypothetical protein